MRIKQLELVGFKSFVNRTALQFSPGVSAIVGPNGCGKSNVVDAIRWVLGEQSPKHLRGTSMEDVIFGGNERRAPLGMAEVSLTFANEGSTDATLNDPDLDLSTIPAQVRSLPEITVTRRYYRSGESEYFINRAACRLKDITELFLGTGIGSKAYAIIEQGRVEQLISAKPEERRWFIEEAAGTTLYRSRRAAAERKMDRTRENLSRVSDVLREVDRQIQYLHRQAKKAEQYRALRTEIRALEIALASAQWRLLRAEIFAAESSLGQLRSEESRLTDALREAETARAEAQRARTEAEHRLSRVRESAARAAAEVETYEQRCGWLRQEAGERERRIERLSGEIDALASRAETLARDAEGILRSRRDYEQRLARQEPALGAKVEAVEQGRGAAATADAVVEDLKGKLVGVLGREAEARNEIAALQRRAEDIRRQIERLTGEEAHTGEELVSLERRLEGQREAASSLRQRQRSLQAEREQHSTSLQRLEGERHQLEQRAASAEERLLQIRSRLRSLEEIQKKYEGYHRGVRATMLRERRDEGVLGVVADVISTPQEHERAVAAVLGERLQYVIVKAEEQGIGAVQMLRAEESGRGSFIPQTPRRWLAQGTEHAPLNGATRRLLDLVQVEDGYKDIAEWLLSDAVLVPDLSTALSIWQQNGRYVTLVTPEGDVIDPSGVITGGSDRPIEEEILSRGREIEELQQTLATVVTEHDRAAAELARVTAAHRRAEVALREIDAQLQELTVGVIGTEKECERLEADRPRWTERIQLVQVDLAAVRREQEEIAREGERCAGDLCRLGEERRRLEEELSARQRECAALKSRVDALVEDVATTRVQFAEDRERLQALSARADEVARHRHEVEHQSERLEAERREAVAERESLLAESTRIAETEKAARERSRTLADEIAAASRQVEEAEAEAARYDDAVDVARQKIDGNRGERSQHETGLAEHRVRIEHLEESMREKHGVDLAALAPPPPAEEAEPQAEKGARLEQLREKLARLGEVNAAAIEEMQQLEERAAFLRTQKEDLERSLADLERTITKLNRASRQRFRETFARVDEQFRVIFPRLFRGGEARLVLTDEQNILESGVEIYVRPPGKKLETVTLLSGGEKALVAVSLIFSLFLINPTPFCFLDEVDAPLDDANVGRFVQMVREMRERSQFIVVTHNKRTMEAADCLYGVTMEEPGVSKVISVAMR